MLPVRFDVESTDKLRYVGRLEQMAPQGVGYALPKDAARDAFAVFTNTLAPRHATRHVVPPGRGISSTTAAANH